MIPSLIAIPLGCPRSWPGPKTRTQLYSVHTRGSLLSVACASSLPSSRLLAHGLRRLKVDGVEPPHSARARNSLLLPWPTTHKRLSSFLSFDRRSTESYFTRLGHARVSSPGVERVVRVPEEIERFKDKPMYVKYTTMDAETSAIQEADGVFSLISFDLETAYCTWGLADVKVNRQKAGKGRPLSKKQRQWRLQIPFNSLRLVRLHSDF